MWRPVDKQVLKNREGCLDLREGSGGGDGSLGGDMHVESDW